MTVVIDGTLGIDTIQDNTVTTAKLAAGAVTPVKTQAGALPSMIHVNTSNGNGSTNINIRRFANATNGVNGAVIQGTDITYADSATLGSTFTINTNGVYAISYCDSFAAATSIALTQNDTALAGAISTIPVAQVLSVNVATAGNLCGFAGWVGYLAAGTVIRPHVDSTGAGAATQLTQFTITRVA